LKVGRLKSSAKITPDNWYRKGGEEGIGHNTIQKSRVVSTKYQVEGIDGREKKANPYSTLSRAEHLAKKGTETVGKKEGKTSF